MTHRKPLARLILCCRRCCWTYVDNNNFLDWVCPGNSKHSVFATIVEGYNTDRHVHGRSHAEPAAEPSAKRHVCATRPASGWPPRCRLYKALSLGRDCVSVPDTWRHSGHSDCVGDAASRGACPCLAQRVAPYSLEKQSQLGSWKSLAALSKLEPSLHANSLSWRAGPLTN